MANAEDRTQYRNRCFSFYTEGSPDEGSKRHSSWVVGWFLVLFLFSGYQGGTVRGG